MVPSGGGSDVRGHRTLEPEEQSERLAPESQELVPDVPLGVVCGSSVLGGAANGVQKLVGQGCRPGYVIRPQLAAGMEPQDERRGTYRVAHRR